MAATRKSVTHQVLFALYYTATLEFPLLDFWLEVNVAGLAGAVLCFLRGVFCAELALSGVIEYCRFTGEKEHN